MKLNGGDKMKNPALELYSELLQMEKITVSTEDSVNLLKAMNKALLAGTNPAAIVSKLRKMEEEVQDSLSGRRVSDMEHAQKMNL